MNKILTENLLQQVIKIFIQYFAVFFIVLLTLVSLSQYKDQGEIDLFGSISFSFPIACLGAAIAAIFIGAFRKLETTPPWVQPSNYIDVDDGLLNKGLSNIRKKRISVFAMFFMWLPLGVFIMLTNLPFFLAFVYLGALFIISNLLYFSKCPRCNHYFFYRSRPGSIGDLGNEKLSLLFGVGYRNILSNKCLNCGFSLKKEKHPTSACTATAKSRRA